MGSNIEKLISFRILRKYLNSFWNETFDEKSRIQRRRKIDDSADVRWHSLLSCRSRTFSSFFPHLIYLRRFMSSVSLSCSLNCDFVCFDINCKQVHISFLHQLSKQRNCWPGKNCWPLKGHPKTLRQNYGEIFERLPPFMSVWYN